MRRGRSPSREFSMTRVAFRLFGVVSLAIAIAPLPLLHAQNAALRELAKKSLARIDGELPMAGLERDVQVIRDRWGIPHIYAQSVDDLFAAQGYVMAQDRLWQMEIWRRTAAG